MANSIIRNLLSGRLNIIRACQSVARSDQNRAHILCDQVLDSLIVGAITGISAYIYAGIDTSLKSALISFLLTFLIKMKEYRKIT